MPSQNQQKKPHIIPTATAVLMLAVALFFDGLQFGTDLVHVIPFIGTVAQSVIDALISVFAWLTFYAWFKIRGVSFAHPKRFLTLNGGGLLEMIPVLNSLPAWTLAVFLLIANTRAEELLEKAGPAGTLAAKAVSGGKGGLPQKPPTLSTRKQ